MKFEWDEQKRLTNIRKHGIDFVDCESVFDGQTLTIVDDRLDYGEQRFVTIGLLADRAVAVAHTETTDSIRVISMRKATKREQKFFFEALQN